MHQPKVKIDNIGGRIIRETEVYRVTDNEHLKHLTLSETVLHPNQQTSGHYHVGLEEVYFFQSGSGTMKVGESTLDVAGGDIILIDDGLFHQVVNTGESDLRFVCVFEKYNR